MRFRISDFAEMSKLWVEQLEYNFRFLQKTLISRFLIFTTAHLKPPLLSIVVFFENIKLYYYRLLCFSKLAGTLT